MNLDDRLRHAFSNLENRVNTHLDDPVLRPVPEQRRHAPRFLVPVLATTVIVLAIGFAAWLGQGQEEVEPPVVSSPTTSRISTTTTTGSTTTTPPAVAIPSQSPDDARRDGIVPELAALPLSDRVDVVDPSALVEGAEGTWVVSRPGEGANAASDGCGLGDPTGTYGVDIICTLEYGEVVLMTSDLSTIVRAYPFPGYPPQWLFETDDALYCGRQGDGALPNSMVCRIDRVTGDVTVRTFRWTGGEEETDDGIDVSLMPGMWTDDTTAETVFGAMRAVDGHLEVGVDDLGEWVAIDPITLELSTGSEPSVLIANEAGVFEVQGAETASVFDSSATRADRLGDVLAVEPVGGHEILMIRNGEQTTVAQIADGDSIRLYGVFETETGPVIAYEYTPAPDPEDIESYRSFLEVYDPDTGDTSRLGRIGGWESAGVATSYADGMWIISMVGEGSRWSFGMDGSSGESVDLNTPLADDCLEPSCQVSLVSVADQDRWVSIEDTDDFDRFFLVVTDAASGDELLRVALQHWEPGSFDVSWPYAVVGGTNPQLIDLTSGEITELPESGAATLP